MDYKTLDKESEEFRPFKEIIKRLNRTYKFHTRASGGFNSTKGVMALTTLLVTYYNFLRPQISLNYSSTFALRILKGAKIIKLATLA